MEPLAILLLLLVIAFIVLFVSLPFFKQQHLPSTGRSPEFSSLLAERERLLNAIQELDFDQSLGKIPAEDYPTQRLELIQKWTEVQRRLDTVSPGNPGLDGGKGHISDSTTISRPLISDDDLEDLLAKRRHTRNDKTAGFCPRCGKPVLQSDVFCPTCGNTLK